MNDRSVEDRLSHFPYEPNAAQWAAVFDESPIGVVFCAKDGTILKANHSFCEIVEYTENELQKKTYRDITHPDDLPFDDGMIQKCIKKEIPGYEMFKRYLSKTGKVVWIRLTVWSITNTQGEVVNFCAHIQKMINGDKARLEKQDTNLIYRSHISVKDIVIDNIKTFIAICIILISSFTGIGVAYWGAIDRVSTLKQQQESQQELLFKLYEILSDNIGKPNESRDTSTTQK